MKIQSRATYITPPDKKLIAKTRSAIIRYIAASRRAAALVVHGRLHLLVGAMPNSRTINVVNCRDEQCRLTARRSVRRLKGESGNGRRAVVNHVLLTVPRLGDIAANEQNRTVSKAHSEEAEVVVHGKAGYRLRFAARRHLERASENWIAVAIGLFLFIFATFPDPDRFRQIGLPCRATRLSPSGEFPAHRPVRICSFRILSGHFLFTPRENSLVKAGCSDQRREIR